MQLSIIIPAYKEASKIQRDIAEADAFLERRRISGEIILVDDGSPDGTADTARLLQKKYPSLRVLSYERNRGKGHAIAQGVQVAKGRYILFADAGMCVPYDIALLGITMLDLDMCDIAMGSRRMRGSTLRAQPSYRRIGSKVFGLFIHAVIGIPGYISDTQCGFKLYRHDVAKMLFGEVVTDGFMFDIEIILRALKHGFRVLEFPVLWSNDADSRFDPLTGPFRLAKELLAMKIAMARSMNAEPGNLPTGFPPREQTHVT